MEGLPYEGISFNLPSQEIFKQRLKDDSSVNDRKDS